MYIQYQLPYSYEALEPHIDATTMETHYSKHHATYAKNLNEAAEKAAVADQEIVALLSSLEAISDEGLRKVIRNNGGGFYNHNIYFSTISPNGGGEPAGAGSNAGGESEKGVGDEHSGRAGGRADLVGRRGTAAHQRR